MKPPARVPVSLPQGESEHAVSTPLDGSSRAHAQVLRHNRGTCVTRTRSEKPSIDRDHDASHVARRLRGHIRYGGGNLFRSAVPLHGDRVRVPLEQCGRRKARSSTSAWRSTSVSCVSTPPAYGYAAKPSLASPAARSASVADPGARVPACVRHPRAPYQRCPPLWCVEKLNACQAPGPHGESQHPDYE